MSEIAEKVINEIAEFNEFNAQLAEFKNKYDHIIYDLTIPEDEKAARSDRLTIGKVIASLDRKHKDLKAPLKARTDLIDGERKRIKDDLLGVQEKIKSQIQQHEDAIREHAEKLQSMVEEIRAYAEFGEYEPPSTSRFLQDRLDSVKKVIVDDSFEDRKADATLAQVDAIKRLEALLAERLKYEEEQEELERLRKEAEERKRQEEHEQIRKEAETRAKVEAEKALEEEKRKVAEAEERGRQLAENAAKEAREKADREFKEALEKEAVKAEQQRQADEAKKAKQAHRNKIHKEAKLSFIDAGYTDEQATEIITLIKDGKIKNVIINY